MKYKDLTGQKFNKLFVICKSNKKAKDIFWICKCNCENQTILLVTTNHLISNHTKSCKCIKKLYPRNEVMARDVHGKRYSDANFEDFFYLAKQSCYYCGIEPNNINYDKRGSGEPFIYNGIDRLNNSNGHETNNIVTCCNNCNSAKNNNSLDYFSNYIDRIITINNRIPIEEYRELSYNFDKNKLIKSRKNHYRRSIYQIFISNYNDGDLTIEQFYRLSQLNCYYCGIKNSNIYFRKFKNYIIEDEIKYSFYYNGLDRINNNLKHDYNNVITCCKICNFAKKNKTIEEFYNWINRLRSRKRFKINCVETGCQVIKL